MFVNQISVFLENRQGRIARFAEVLGAAGVNIRHMSIADTTDFGILRAVTDDNARAIAALKAAGFSVASTDLIGFRVEDKPGEMEKVLKILDEGGVNISYLYSFTRAPENYAVILIKVRDPEGAIGLLKEQGVSLVDEVL